MNPIMALQQKWGGTKLITIYSIKFNLFGLIITALK